jgi:hypothetical protein
MQFKFFDTTLRDGEQGPAVAFSAQARARIARAPYAVGVQRIEAGVPVMGGEGESVGLPTGAETSAFRSSAGSAADSPLSLSGFSDLRVHAVVSEVVGRARA